MRIATGRLVQIASTMNSASRLPQFCLTLRVKSATAGFCRSQVRPEGPGSPDASPFASSTTNRRSLSAVSEKSCACPG